jgi:2-oxoglutarate ferredoxin oxidoreductase subunit alpha
MDRGKVLWEEDVQKMESKWGRYLDLDGDGITYRTLPGNKAPNAAYFARGTGHDEYANYSEQPEDWEKNLLRLGRKIDNNIALLPKPIIKTTSGTKISIISYGSTDVAIEEAMTILLQYGLKIDQLRVRSLPAGPELTDFVHEHERNYVVELNRDGQLHQILCLEIPDSSMKLLSLSHLDGLPLTAQWVVNQITAKEDEQK